MFRKFATRLSASALLLALAAADASATPEKGGVEIGGHVDQRTTVLGTANTTAFGLNTEACTTIGGIGENPDC